MHPINFTDLSTGNMKLCLGFNKRERERERWRERQRDEREGEGDLRERETLSKIK